MGNQVRLLHPLRSVLILWYALQIPLQGGGEDLSLELFLRLNFWTGLFLAALSCTAPEKAAEDDKAQEETLGDGTTTGTDPDSGAEDDTPDDEHWMTIRARVQVDLYTTDESEVGSS